MLQFLIVESKKERGQGQGQGLVEMLVEEEIEVTRKMREMIEVVEIIAIAKEK